MELNHVLVQTTDLEASTRFWTDLIGLTEGDRPPFNFPGAWYYADGIPVIHLAVRPEVGAAGAVDHVALVLSAEEYEDARARLVESETDFRETVVPERGDRQIFVIGPDGIRVELQCPNR